MFLGEETPLKRKGTSDRRRYALPVETPEGRSDSRRRNQLRLHRHPVRQHETRSDTPPRGRPVWRSPIARSCERGCPCRSGRNLWHRVRVGSTLVGGDLTADEATISRPPSGTTGWTSSRKSTRRAPRTRGLSASLFQFDYTDRPSGKDAINRPVDWRNIETSRRRDCHRSSRRPSRGQYSWSDRWVWYPHAGQLRTGGDPPPSRPSTSGTNGTTRKTKGNPKASHRTRLIPRLATRPTAAVSARDAIVSPSRGGGIAAVVRERYLNTF